MLRRWCSATSDAWTVQVLATIPLSSLQQPQGMARQQQLLRGSQVLTCLFLLAQALLQHEYRQALVHLRQLAYSNRLRLIA